MAKQSVEDIKRESQGLRGRIVETLESTATHFEEAEYQLLKFHGSYQQDDRDQRSELRKQKLDKAWSFMVRNKMPGGAMTAAQYLDHDRISDELANHTLRITSRQGIQFHGILKGGLKDVVARIHDTGLTTWGACGDVVRNTMGPAAPIADAAHQDAHKLAEELNDRFLARSSSYNQIWLNGEKLETQAKIAGNGEADEEPVYGSVYLPRKFKIGIAIPPCNDVDVFSQDIGFVPHLEDGGVTGYTVLVGGGFGMTHGMIKTRPVLAKPLAYVERKDAVEVAEAIVKIQREYGNRKDRKQARLKYLVESAGIRWFLNAMHQRVSCPLHPPRDVEFDSVADLLGWHEQGDGKLFCSIYVPQGRIQDTGSVKFKSLFKKIAAEFEFPVRLTPNTNFMFHDIDPGQKDAIDAILSEHGVSHTGEFTEMRKTAHACVALPTCGLALSESERVFDDVLDKIDAILRELGLQNEPLLIRMTGCPNGCARPYNADIGFVGRAPGKYAMFVGGSIRGNRLAALEKKVVTFEEIPGEVRPLLEEFAANRQEGERFSDFWGRTRETAVDPEQFHLEIEERQQSILGAAGGI